MPFELVYLVAVFAVAIVGFALLKRPMYESMLAAFIVLVILTAVLGAWDFSLTGLWGFIWKAMKDSSLYVIIVFIVSAHLLSQTTVIDQNIELPSSASGECNLYLNLPDPCETLHNNPLFSIRLANEDVWEEKTGMNKLTTLSL